MCVANLGMRHAKYTSLVGNHLVEQVELFDASHELIDRLGLDRVLLICNSVCARAGKSVLA
jgi:hypothetical protein